MKDIEDKILQNMGKLLPDYKKDLLDFTFTLLEKQEREMKKYSAKQQSAMNKEFLAELREEREKQRAEQDLLREMWRVKQSSSDG